MSRMHPPRESADTARELVAERQCECGEHGHCLHDRIAGQVIVPGTRRCCMCGADVLTPALVWEGDGA